MGIVLFFLFLAIAVGVVVSIVVWTVRNGISPMPTSPMAMRCLLQAFPEGVEGKIVEMGSGWGTLLFPLAREFPRCRIIGYESSPVPYFFSKVRHYLFPLKNIEIHRRDFFKEPLGDADLVVCYLYPGAMERLKGKFEKELKTDAWVMSNTFAVPGWEPLRTVLVNDLFNTKIYIYRSQV